MTLQRQKPDAFTLLWVLFSMYMNNIEVSGRKAKASESLPEKRKSKTLN